MIARGLTLAHIHCLDIQARISDRFGPEQKGIPVTNVAAITRRRDRVMIVDGEFDDWP
jgi:hypothetical protein